MRTALDLVIVFLVALVAGRHHRRVRTEPPTAIERQTEPRVTQRQLDMMRHATGGKLDGERNYFTAAPGSENHHAWSELVTMGLAEVAAPVTDAATHAIYSEDVTFHVTEAGFRMAYGDVRKPKRGKR